MSSFDVMDYIAVYNFMSPAECDQLISYSTGWKSHTWYVPETNIIETRENDPEICFLSESNKRQYCEAVLQIANTQYIKEVGVEFDSLLNASNPRMNRYYKDQYMRPHVDHIYNIFDGEQRGIPVLTSLSFLNDDYTGGEFGFFIGGKEINVPVKKGDIIIFPSTFIYKHYVKQVINGERITCVSWLY